MAGESARELARRQREKAARLLQAAERNDKGADGEEETARALASLPSEEWTVFHDVRWPDRRLANVDHVVVGPAGVFVIDSKNWSGTITVKDDVLRQNGYRRENEVVSAAEAAMAITRLVPDVPPSTVFAVLCFTTGRPMAGYARDVAVCTTTNLVEMLTTRPRVLSREQRLWTTSRLDVRLVKAGRRVDVGKAVSVSVRPTAEPPHAPQGVTNGAMRARAPRRRAGHPRARRHGAAALVQLLVALLVAAAFLLVVTRTDVIERFSDYVVHLGTSTPQSPPTQPEVTGSGTTAHGAQRQHRKKHTSHAARTGRAAAASQDRGMMKK